MQADIYSNTPDTDFVTNFFLKADRNSRQALLAAPFFTDYSPIKTLTQNGCSVLLIVKLCEATSPEALKNALEDQLVKVRYYTSDKFHPKLYIIDDVALVGSANLTTSGMTSNREVSVTLRRERDEAFTSLPGIFDELWTYADVLTPEVVDSFEAVKQKHSSASNRKAFDDALESIIVNVEPPSVVVGSRKISRERNFIQSFNRKYDEVLIPYHNELMEVAQSAGFGRPEYKGEDPQIEMGRFLGWVRLVHGPKDKWRENSLCEDNERKRRISDYVAEWQSASDIKAGDATNAEAEIANIKRIRSDFGSEASIDALAYDDLFDTLLGCHAFLEQLRFTKGGLDGLRVEFGKRNSLRRVKETLKHLLHGRGEGIERAYDCIFDSKYKLEKFAEASTMELLGWHSSERPPFNNRTIRGMRFLGYDTEHFVAGA